MNIQVMSDLHTEITGRSPILKEDIVGDVIILAGDICNEPTTISKSLPKDRPIFHVLGNHEYYHNSFKGRVAGLQEQWNKLGFNNVDVLENRAVTIDSVRFLGTTLWTNLTSEDGDFQGFDCKRGMNDFYLIRDFSLTEWLNTHRAAILWLQEELAKPFDGKTVVITHHAPSFRSNGERFLTSTIRAGFCTDMEYLMEQESIDVWIHGHTHEPSDYMVHGTRVICNPYGYEQPNAYRENLKYNPRFLVEVK